LVFHIPAFGKFERRSGPLPGLSRIAEQGFPEGR
jgi:hypothetical protein